MSDWQEVAQLSDIDDDTNLALADYQGQAICLYRLDGQIYATQDLCTHGNASLSEGWIEGDEIECPLHQGMFDIRSGKPSCAPVTEPLKTYEVKLEDVVISVRPKGA